VPRRVLPIVVFVVLTQLVCVFCLAQIDIMKECTFQPQRVSRPTYQVCVFLWLCLCAIESFMLIWCARAHASPQGESTERDHFHHMHQQSILLKNRKIEREASALREQEAVRYCHLPHGCVTGTDLTAFCVKIIWFV
jgi:hypothetical protein